MQPSLEVREAALGVEDHVLLETERTEVVQQAPEERGAAVGPERLRQSVCENGYAEAMIATLAIVVVERDGEKSRQVAE